MTTHRDLAVRHIEAASADNIQADYPLAQLRATLAVAEAILAVAAILARVDLEQSLWREVEKHEAEDPPLLPEGLAARALDLAAVRDFLGRAAAMCDHFRALVTVLPTPGYRAAAEKRLGDMEGAFARIRAAIPALTASYADKGQ